MIVKDINTGNDIYFSMRKEDGNVFFMMDDCECTMKVSDAKKIIDELKKVITKAK